MTPLRRAGLGALTSLLLAGAAAPRAWAQDTAGPVLVDCTVAPSLIDVTAGSAAGTWTIQASDDQSGVATAAVIFGSPGFTTFLSANVGAAELVAGDPLAGTWARSFEVPEFSPSGSWTVFALSLRDVAGNTTAVPLASLPPSCGFDVASLPDAGPPTLAGLGAAPGAVDVTLGPAPVTLTAVLEDDRSGVDHATVTFESPSGVENVAVDFDAAERSSGDALSGTYTVGFDVPQLAETGTWTVASVRIVDVYGWVADLDGAALGIPSPPTLDVSSTPDDIPPELVWLSASPSTVYLGATPPSVELSARIRDDVTGLDFGGILLESPVDGVVEAVTIGASERVDGTALDGLYRVTIVFANDAPTGSWTLSASVADAAGNSTQYTSGGIPGPQQIGVAAGSPPPPSAVPVLGPAGVALLALGLLASGASGAWGARR